VVWENKRVNREVGGGLRVEEGEGMFSKGKYFNWGGRFPPLKEKGSWEIESATRREKRYAIKGQYFDGKHP